MKLIRSIITPVLMVFIGIPLTLIVILLALIACIILAPARLYDLASGSDTDWSNSPYSFLTKIFYEGK